MIKTRRFRRPDGWDVIMRTNGDKVVYLSHLPMIVSAPPDPLTIEYVELACQVHGYFEEFNE